jgi:hypothetical protein
MGITRGLTTWKFQDNYVERVMDNAAYTAAHPDDTLIMAGPPRTPDPTGTVKAIDSKLLAIGHLQQVQFTQQKPTQPVMAIGSGRTFFVSGKAQGQCTLGRLFVNGRNLLRILNHNMRSSGMDVSKFDDRPAKSSARQYYINLDSELYLIPFGLGCLFRDKIHHVLGGFYSELSMITTYAIGLTAGQNMVMEQVNVVFDRLMPFFEHDISDYQISQTSFDSVMGFVDETVNEMAAPTDRLANMLPPAPSV